MKPKIGILTTVCVATLAINLDTTIVNVALPTMAHELSAGELVAVRAVMGAFGALIFPTTLSIIRNAFPDRRQRAAALGAWGAVVGLGVAGGPVVGGLLLTHFSWGSVFLALAPVALVAAGLTLALVPESRDASVPRLDLPGLALSVALLGLLVWTIIEAPAAGWSSARTIGGFVGAAVLLVAFVACERTAAHPMLDVTLFRDRRFSAASGAVTITFFALFGFIFLITQYFQLIRGYSTLSAGARTLPVALSIAIASVLGARLAPRIGTKAVVTTGLLLFGIAFLWISTVGVDAAYGTVIVPQMVLMGLGMGAISTPATESILLVLPPARAGVGSAVNDATRELGGTLGVAVVGSYFSSVYAAHLTSGAFGSLPAPAVAHGKDSVGAAVAIAHDSPALLASVRDSFMAGLHAGSLLVAVVCLVGAVTAILFLPGRLPSEATAAARPEEVSLTPVA